MAYPALPDLGTISEEQSVGFLEDIASRKEFSRFSVPPPDEKDASVLTGFRAHAEQRFVAEFQNPHTRYLRFFLNWATGTGKTDAAIVISRAYFKFSPSVDPPRTRVFVIGFTKDIFIDRMLSRVEYKFISSAELTELRRVGLAVAQGAVELKNYAAYMGALRRRITDVGRGGYYQFYGFKEFANRVFVRTSAGARTGFDVQKVYTQSESLEDARQAIAKAVEEKLIALNAELVDALQGSLIIVDEIHNVYNIKEKNTYGVAIQYVLDTLSAAGSPAVPPRVLFLSATPMTGSATEIVDLLNLLVPREDLIAGGYDPPLKKADFFVESAKPAGARESARAVSVLRRGALEEISALTVGRVSFLIDTNVASYPERIFVGQSYASIPYLKFEVCEAGAYQRKSIETALGPEAASVPVDAYSAYDVAFPNPGSAAHGLVRSDEIVEKITRASPEWMEKTGVVVKWAQAAERTPIISGSWLGSGLGRYSAKYATMVRDLVAIIRAGPGKVLVYHDRVQMSGVLLLEEILRYSGFIDESSTPTDGTMCAVCGHARKGHRSHQFEPARFVSIHYNVDKSTIRRSLDKFNSPANVDGNMCRVLLGSRIIREGFDFSCVRHELILSAPPDISTLVQIMGRVIRSGSHRQLAPEDRNVRIKIYVTSISGSRDSRSFELAKYADKMHEYLVIQKINRAIWQYAVDAYTNYPKIKRVFGVRRTAEPTLDALPYVPAVEPAPNSEGIHRKKSRGSVSHALGTFYAYGYSTEEVETIKSVIWGLFRLRRVWTYDDLYGAVLRSGADHGVDEDTSGIAEENFALALEQVMRVRSENSVVAVGQELAAVYYVLVPLGASGEPIVDVEVYSREAPMTDPIEIPLEGYIKDSHTTSMLDTMLASFAERYATDSRNAAGRVAIEFALAEQNDDFHYAMMQRIVESGAGLGALADLAALYEKARLMLYDRDVVDAAGSRKMAAGSAPVGYYTRDSVHVWSPSSGWREQPRSSLAGRSDRFNENEIIVGFLDKKDTHMKFKIRQPLSLILRDVKDTRTIDRGMVCGTVPREKQLAYLARLVRHARGAQPPLLVKTADDPCKSIYLALLSLELEERKKNGMDNGVRWMYLFNDRLPVLSKVP